MVGEDAFHLHDLSGILTLYTARFSHFNYQCRPHFDGNGEAGRILKIILPPPIIKNYAGKFGCGRAAKPPISFVNIHEAEPLLPGGLQGQKGVPLRDSGKPR